MRITVAAFTAMLLALGALAPAAHANHQQDDAFIGSGGSRGGGTVPAEPAAVLEPGGFDWSDATVGAAVALGTLLLLLGLALVARRTRPRAA